MAYNLVSKRTFFTFKTVFEQTKTDKMKQLPKKLLVMIYFRAIANRYQINLNQHILKAYHLLENLRNLRFVLRSNQKDIIHIPHQVRWLNCLIFIIRNI